MPYSKITGLGFYVPENVISNHHLAQYMDTSDEWIRERTGIVERRFFSEGKDTTAKMGARAAAQAMERAGVGAEEIDFIIFATLSPDYYFPGSGVLLQRMLPFRHIGALDIRAQCAGFVYGLSVADQFIRTGMYRRVLVVGAEIQSNIIELSDRGRAMAVLFGDGAGAAVLEATQDPEHCILSTHLHADGNFAEDLFLEHPGAVRKKRLTAEMIEKGEHLPFMRGNAVFKHAVTRFPEVILEALQSNGYSTNDLKLLIPHQANLRISQHVQQVLGLRSDQVFNNIQKYGNTTAASIPIALTEAWEAGYIQTGDLICLAAFGSGFVWASALIRW